MIFFTKLRKFFRPTPAEEAERGKQNAQDFLATKPTSAEISEYWGAACCDEDFSSEPGRAYAKAVKDIIRPYLMGQS